MSSKLVFCAETIPLEVLSRLGFSSDIIRIGDRITFHDSPETAMLSRIEYDKQMYHPGHVSLKFTSVISQASPAPLIRKKYLDNIRFIDLIAVEEVNYNLERITSDDIVYIAQNYYIQGFSIKYEKTDTYSFTLDCYSFDRKLTLSKYCKVYADVSLATGICNEIIREQLGDLYTKLSEVNGRAPDELKASDLFLLGYYLLTDDEKNRVTRVMSLQDKSRRSSQEEKELADSLANYKSKGFLSYDGKLRVSAEADYGYRTLTENNNEVTHPYLVQYNESAYDFIARTAHMCGEFFYFEHGKICMGLPKSSRELVFDSKANPRKEYTGFFSYSAVADDEEAGAVASSVEFYHGDYMRGDAVSSGKKRFLADNVSDESFYPKKEDMVERINYSKGSAVANAFGSLFTIPRSPLAASGETLITFGLEMLSRCYSYPKGTKKWLNKHHPDPTTPKKNTPPGNECKVSDEYAFNMSNEALDLIGVLEETSEQGRVELSFESILPNLYLGDPIRLSNVEGSPSAIVVGIHGEFHADYQDGNLSQTKSHFVEVLKYVEYKSKSNETYRLPLPSKSSVRNELRPVPMTGSVVANNDPCFLGRVKVELDCDKSKTTPWIRVIVPFASGGDEKGGFCMVPSVGEHVIVDYLEGNINKPFVMGSLYYRHTDLTQDHAPSIGDYPNDSRFYRDDYKTRSIVSGNGHAIVFKDLEDTSWMKMIFPPLNALWPAGNVNKFVNTGKKQDIPLLNIKGGGITIRDGSGMCRVDIDPDHRTLKLDSRFGNVEMNAFTGITINAPNGDVTIRGKNIVMEAGNNITLQAGTNINNSLKADPAEFAGSLVGLAAGKAATAVLKSMTGVDMEGMFDLSYLRSIIEIFIRPVEGSLQLKSNRNTIITSGNGKVTLDSSLRSSASTFTPGRKGDKFTAFNALSEDGRDTTLNDHVDTQDAYIALKDVISVLLDNVDKYYSAIIKLWTNISNSAGAIVEILNSADYFTKEFRILLEKDEHKIDRESVLNFCFSEKSFKYDPIKKTLDDFPTIDQVFKPIDKNLDNLTEDDLSLYHKMLPIFNSLLGTKYNNLKKEFTNLYKVIRVYERNSFSNILELDRYLRRSEDKSRFSLKIHADRISCVTSDEVIDGKIVITIDKLSIKKKDLKSELLSIPLPKIEQDEVKNSVLRELTSQCNRVEYELEQSRKCAKKSIIIKCLLGAKIGDRELLKFKQRTNDYNSFKQYVQGGDSNWSDFVLGIQDTNSHNYTGLGRFLFSPLSSSLDNSVKGVYSYANGQHAIAPSLMKLLNYEGEAGPRSFNGEVGQTGAILMSTSAGKYTQYDEYHDVGEVRYNPDVDVLKRYLLNLF